MRLLLLLVCLLSAIPAKAQVAAAEAARALADAQRRAREAVLARDTVELFPELRGSLLGEADQDRLGRALGDDRFIIRIKQVDNDQGNNPWHPRDPVLNFDGRDIASLDELLVLVRGGAVGGGPAGCIRTVPMNAVVPGLVWSGNFELNPSTLTCTMPPPGTPGDGSFSIVVGHPVTAPGETTHCVGGIAGLPWNHVAGPVCQAYTLGDVVTFQAQSTAGRRIEVRFRATWGAPPSLEVISITPLN